MDNLVSQFWSWVASPVTNGLGLMVLGLVWAWIQNARSTDIENLTYRIEVLEQDLISLKETIEENARD